MYPWDSWRTFIPIILGLAGFFAFVMYEKLIPAVSLSFRCPLYRSVLPQSKIGDRRSRDGALVPSLILALYHEAVKGSSPILAGVDMYVMSDGSPARNSEHPLSLAYPRP